MTSRGKDWWEGSLKAAEAHGAAGTPCASYRIATLQQRTAYLVKIFLRLDLDAQQQLIALASALVDAAGNSEAENRTAKLER